MTRMERLKVKRRLQRKIRATVEERRLAIALAPALSTPEPEPEPAPEPLS